MPDSAHSRLSGGRRLVPLLAASLVVGFLAAPAVPGAAAARPVRRPDCPPVLQRFAPPGLKTSASPCRPSDGGAAGFPARPAGPSPGGSQCLVQHEGLENRCSRWVSRYDGTGSGWDVPLAIAAGPDGATAYVTGYSEVPHPSAGYAYDYVTIAYDTASGAERWRARYDGPAGLWDIPSALVLSPDGGRLFVTGAAQGAESYDYATVAYDASSGQQLWSSVHDGPAAGVDIATALAVSPDGREVFVTGTSDSGAGTGFDFATVAHDAATGSQSWTRRHAGDRNYEDAAHWVGVSPDGESVYVAGTLGPETDFSFGLAAYRFDGGDVLEPWTASYDTPGNHPEIAAGFGMSPDGSRLYVSGEGWGADHDPDAVTVAFGATTGQQLWVARDDPADWSGATSLSVADDGTVFVAGWTFQYRPNNLFGDRDFLTLAYAPDGSRRWMTRFDAPGSGNDVALAVEAHGAIVHVTGSSQPVPSGAFGLFYDYATVTYGSADGTRRWVARYDGLDQDVPTALTASGGWVLVTGASFDPIRAYDYATLSYDA